MADAKPLPVPKANPKDRKGTKGKVRLSNRTDRESTKMATGKGVIQGYTEMAAVG